MALIYQSKTLCYLCEKIIASSDEVIAFPAFILNELEPLFLFSDTAFHKKCVLNHPLGNQVPERLEEWYAKTGPCTRKCRVCHQEIMEPDNYLLIEHLTSDSDHPLYDYNYTHLHKSCLGIFQDREKVRMLIKQLNHSGKWSGSYLQTLYDSLELPISANQPIKQNPIMENITLSPNFQLIIPKSICKQLHLPIGQQFVLQNKLVFV